MFRLRLTDCPGYQPADTESLEWSAVMHHQEKRHFYAFRKTDRVGCEQDYGMAIPWLTTLLAQFVTSSLMALPKNLMNMWSSV
jgi:hypothetical protein